MRKNIFIPALTDLQREELETIKSQKQVDFHSLLDYKTLVEPDEIHFDALLDQCRKVLLDFRGSVDGIIPHWDFPTSVLTPILCREFNLLSPSLESVLKCEHKYWSRVEQEKSIPDCIPKFCRFDPFSADPMAEITLEYPFWIKPVKSFASQLGFMVENPDQFQAAIAKIRKAIHLIGDAFDEAMAHADAPDGIRASGGNTCIAEEIISGVQSAPEGSVHDGEFKIHGFLDMLKDSSGKSFEQLVYPSILPRDVQDRMASACGKFLRDIGFDNGCFNAEFMWDQATDKLRLIEFNTRISQSHSEMFIKVDGQSNHKVALDVALGKRPNLGHGGGEFAFAAKFQINYHGGDGVVVALPGEDAIRALKTRFPRTEIELIPEPGDRLSELHNQDAYSYHLGDIYLGASSHEELLERFHTCLQSLEFEIRPLNEEHSSTVTAGGYNEDDHLISV